MSAAGLPGRRQLAAHPHLPAAHTAPTRAPSRVLQGLVGDKSLERFRTEYDKLHRALKKSRESEKRLIKKCRGSTRRCCNSARDASQSTRADD